MVSHGLATGGLFAVVGLIYERFHTREIGDFGGLARRMPVLAFFAMLLTLSSIALPGTAGFAGEFPLLLGVFQRGWAESGVHSLQLRTIAVLSLTGVVLGAWYMLWMYQRVFFGTPSKRIDKSVGWDKRSEVPPTVGNDSGETGHRLSHATVGDLSAREIICLVLVVIPIFWIGLQPSFFLNRMSPTLDDLMEPAMRAAERTEKRGAFRKSPAIAKPQAAGTEDGLPSQSLIPNP
jgi:NADH-quinone oxidoreductase subunit M